MKLDIKTKDLDLTDAIRAHIEEKIASLDRKVERFGDVVSAEVEVGRTTEHHQKGNVYRAEIHIRLPGKLVYASDEGEDLYACINEAKQQAERQIIDYKEKMADEQKHGSGEEK